MKISRTCTAWSASRRTSCFSWMRQRRRPRRASLHPYVFTEQGVAMLSGVLRSKRAIVVDIEIMRAFVELRRAAASYAALEERLRELERETTARFGRHDEQL